MITLTQWFDYIESLHPKSIELGLERVRTVAAVLDVFPEEITTIFTIAGTNGKGSCAALSEAILMSAGYRVAVYTSPHLLRFNERIRINGVEISDQSLLEAFEAVEKARADILLTYFEFTTLAAFFLFKQMNLDVWILEVGLGGRLDTVNIINPNVAIITTVAMDHMDWLGDDREKIGKEKAGIMRENIPVVCGDPDPPQSILKAAEACHARLYTLNQQFFYQQDSPSDWSWRSDAQPYQHLPVPHLPLQNAATTLMALSLSDLTVDIQAISRGLEEAKLMGRFQTFTYPVQTILDVAHNPQSAAYLAERLQASRCSGKTRAIVGMLKDKDILNTLSPLLPYIDDWYVATLDVPRGEIAENTANYLHKLGVTAYHKTSSVESAFQSAVDVSLVADRIVVFGSFYTVAGVLNIPSPTRGRG